MTDKTETPAQDADKEKNPNIFQVIASVTAALFGVQSGKNRERDFEQGDASQFIIVGVILTIAMVLGVMIAVNIALG